MFVSHVQWGGLTRGKTLHYAATYCVCTPSGGAVLHEVRPYSGRYRRRFRGRFRGRFHRCHRLAADDDDDDVDGTIINLPFASVVNI